MHRASAHVRAALVSVVLTVSAICILASPTLGQVRRRDKAGKAPPASVEDRIDAQQARAWSGFYAGKHQQAARQAGALLKAPKEYVRVQAAHCQARCYWAVGGKSRSTSGRAKAKRIWTKLEKASTLNANLQRLVISKALMAEAGEKDAEAIELLEGVLKRGLSDTCTAEAAIELGRLQAKARRFAEARRAYDFAVRFLDGQVRREVSAAVVEPFVKAARKARINRDGYCFRPLGPGTDGRSQRTRPIATLAAVSHRGIIQPDPKALGMRESKKPRRNGTAKDEARSSLPPLASKRVTVPIYYQKKNFQTQ